MTHLFDSLYRRVSNWTGLRWYVVLTLPLTVSLNTHPSPPQLRIREATREDLEAALASPEVAINAEFLTAALQRGDRCFAAFEGKKIVAFTWRARHRAPHEVVGVAADKPFIYGYKGATQPQWRGHRLNAIVNHCANQAYLDDGYSHMVTFTAIHNRKSLAAMGEDSGYQKIGFVVYLPLLGKLVQYRSPSVRETGLRFGVPDPASSSS